MLNRRSGNLTYFCFLKKFCKLYKGTYLMCFSNNSPYCCHCTNRIHHQKTSKSNSCRLISRKSRLEYVHRIINTGTADFFRYILILSKNEYQRLLLLGIIVENFNGRAFFVKFTCPFLFSN